MQCSASPPPLALGVGSTSHAPPARACTCCPSPGPASDSPARAGPDFLCLDAFLTAPQDTPARMGAGGGSDGSGTGTVSTVGSTEEHRGTSERKSNLSAGRWKGASHPGRAAYYGAAAWLPACSCCRAASSHLHAMSLIAVCGGQALKGMHGHRPVLTRPAAGPARERGACRCPAHLRLRLGAAGQPAAQGAAGRRRVGFRRLPDQLPLAAVLLPQLVQALPHLKRRLAVLQQGGPPELRHRSCAGCAEGGSATHGKQRLTGLRPAGASCGCRWTASGAAALRTVAALPPPRLWLPSCSAAAAAAHSASRVRAAAAGRTLATTCIAAQGLLTGEAVTGAPLARRRKTACPACMASWREGSSPLARPHRRSKSGR